MAGDWVFRSLPVLGKEARRAFQLRLPMKTFTWGAFKGVPVFLVPPKTNTVRISEDGT